MDDQEFQRRLVALDQRQEMFLNCLDALDRRDTALLERLQRLKDRLDVLAG